MNNDILKRLRKILDPRRDGEASLIRDAAEEIERLRGAAERVCWFDWSGNDEDAVAAVEGLRSALEQKSVDKQLK